MGKDTDTIVRFNHETRGFYLSTFIHWLTLNPPSLFYVVSLTFEPVGSIQAIRGRHYQSRRDWSHDATGGSLLWETRVQCLQNGDFSYKDINVFHYHKVEFDSSYRSNVTDCGRRVSVGTPRTAQTRALD